MNEISPFDITPDFDYVYQQYRDNAELESFFKIIDEYIEDHYFKNTLAEMWECRDIVDTKSAFLYFYSRYYLGLIRPVREDPDDLSTEATPSNVINQYDTAMFYDKRFIWDDYLITDPEMPLSLFIALMGFVYNYSYETWTHEIMIKYASVLCNTSPIDIHISFENNKVVYWLPNSQQNRAFIAYTKTDEYKLNFPFADCYEYRIGDHKRDTDRIDEFMLGYMRPPAWPTFEISDDRLNWTMHIFINSGGVRYSNTASLGGFRLRNAKTGKWETLVVPNDLYPSNVPSPPRNDTETPYFSKIFHTQEGHEILVTSNYLPSWNDYNWSFAQIFDQTGKPETPVPNDPGYLSNQVTRSPFKPYDYWNSSQDHNGNWYWDRSDLTISFNKSLFNKYDRMRFYNGRRVNTNVHRNTFDLTKKIWFNFNTYGQVMPRTEVYRIEIDLTNPDFFISESKAIIIR